MGFFPRPWGPGAQALVLADVVPGSPAFDAGLQPDDELLAVDGRRVAEIPVDELEAIIQGEPGVELTLTIRRDGEEFRVLLVRDSWL